MTQSLLNVQKRKAKQYPPELLQHVFCVVSTALRCFAALPPVQFHHGIDDFLGLLPRIEGISHKFICIKTGPIWQNGGNFPQLFRNFRRSCLSLRHPLGTLCNHGVSLPFSSHLPFSCSSAALALLLILRIWRYPHQVINPKDGDCGLTSLTSNVYTSCFLT